MDWLTARSPEKQVLDVLKQARPAGTYRKLLRDR